MKKIFIICAACLSLDIGSAIADTLELADSTILEIRLSVAVTVPH